MADRAGGGTSVGRGASSIVRMTGDFCGATTFATCGCVTGMVSFALSKAQPPTVAATEAAVISILTPGTPVAGRLLDDWDGGIEVFSRIDVLFDRFSCSINPRRS